MIRTTRRAAAGFTLIELLVVISIIAILLALSGAAYQKAAESQRNRSADDLMNRLQPALDAEYHAAVEQCRKDRTNKLIPQAVIDYCEGDPERTLAVWTAAKLWRQFPTTFAEALATVAVTQDGSGTYYVRVGPVPAGESVRYNFPALPIFSKVSGYGSGNPQQESAALLFIILAERSAGGNGGFDAASVTNGEQMEIKFSSGTGKAFRDAWNNPVSFARWATPAEVQSAPFVDAKATNKDPLDPLQRVSGWSNATKRGEMSGLLGFNNQNRMATVYTPGKNATFDNYTGDDLVGYRLRRLGTKGK